MEAIPFQLGSSLGSTANCGAFFPCATAYENRVAEKSLKGAQAATGDLVQITRHLDQTSYEAEGSTRYGMDMIADSFAALAKASGKPADEDAWE